MRTNCAQYLFRRTSPMSANRAGFPPGQLQNWELLTVPYVSYVAQTHGGRDKHRQKPCFNVWSDVLPVKTEVRVQTLTIGGTSTPNHHHECATYRSNQCRHYLFVDEGASKPDGPQRAGQVPGTERLVERKTDK